MKAKTHILFLIVFFPVFCNAQAEVSTEKFDLIKTYPLNLVYIQEFNLAYETLINERMGYEVLLGSSLYDHVYYSGEFDFPITGEAEPGERVRSTNVLTRISFKRYVGKKKSPPKSFYYSPQLILKYSVIKDHHYNVIDAGYEAWVDLNKLVAGLNFLIGKQYLIKDRVSFGWYFGLGVRYTPYSETIYKSHYCYEDTDPCEYDYQKRGNHYFQIRPTIHFGMSLGIAWKESENNN